VSEGATPDDIGVRPPEEVMRLDRMGAAFQTRLSFLRILLRRMGNESWRITRPRFDLDDEGYGTALYTVETPSRHYSLIAYSQFLDPAARTDRVIAEAWDAAFILYDGIPTSDDIARLATEAPRQEAGRYSAKELVLSRANKSVRLFTHVSERLAEGRQPDRNLLREIGYLMRTTAVYGNGKFGLADRRGYADRPELAGPFQAEMLAVYLIRCFTFDLLEHVGERKNPSRYTTLDRRLKRYLGIGNSTGLGMAPFLVSHPVLIHNWFSARETALARVRSVSSVKPERIALFQKALVRAREHVEEWQVEDEVQTGRIDVLRSEIRQISEWLPMLDGSARPWDDLYSRAAVGFSLEGQELLVSLLLEPYPELVDELTEELSADPLPFVDATMTVGTLNQILSDSYDWVSTYNFDDASTNRYVWYYSEEKLEPRRGEQRHEITDIQAMNVAIARDVQQLQAALSAEDATLTIAAFLLEHPEFRYIVNRVQVASSNPYAEIRENLIGESCRPIDLLRAKLAYFGATKFDPKSDLWTRITMYQGAPLADELDEADDWCFPSLGEEE
jgi:hypothetical protein